MSDEQPIDESPIKETPPDPVQEAFYSGALARISQNMLIMAPLLAAGAWWKFGLSIALGLVSGCAIAYLNFHWLKRVVAAVVDRTTQTGVKQSSAGVVLRFLLRYSLMAVAAYVMIKRWPESLNGLLVGLFLPVIAVMWEAARELMFSAMSER